MKNKTLVQNSISIALAVLIGTCPIGKTLYGFTGFTGVNLDAFNTFTSTADSPANGSTIWRDLSSKFSISSDTSPLPVQQHIKKLAKSQDYITEMTHNSRPFIYYVEQETAKRGVPGELALIPMIESAYNPDERSYAGAKGMWQLMPQLAKDLGLKHDGWVDGTKSVPGATDAALKQFIYLHQTFKDWLLAIAAYNAGEGAVKKAIKYNLAHNKPTDFWSLPLPAQTRDYVPKLLALADIIKNPQRYNVKLESIPNRPYFATINVQNEKINLNNLARLAQVDVKQMHKLNAAFQRSVTPPTGSYSLLVPVESAATVKKQLPNVAESANASDNDSISDDSQSKGVKAKKKSASHKVSHKRAHHKKG